jgi:hypothetical protein
MNLSKKQWGIYKHPYVHLYWVFNGIYTLPLNFNLKVNFHPPWNYMVWYVCVPTWYCELQCSGISLIQQLNTSNNK